MTARETTPERYVNAGELAALMGVSVSTIKRMVTAGMPSETWGMKRTRRFLPSAAIKWAAGRTDSVTTGSKDPLDAAPQTPRPSNTKEGR
jgi:phage terminase Nu1 subunit (DNA packaging protein)